MTEREPLKIAFSSDIHLAKSGERTLNYDTTYDLLNAMSERADALILAGDLTQSGTTEQIQMFAEISRDLPVPIYAVLGNHDRRVNADATTHVLSEYGGIVLLPGHVHTIQKNRTSVDIIGVEGGYDGSFATNLTEMQQNRIGRVRKRLESDLTQFNQAASSLNAHPSVAVFHFVPDRSMIEGEKEHGYFMLGSQRLGETADTYNTHIREVFHGHAHLGKSHGSTQAGIPITNVAIPVYLRQSRENHGKYIIEELFVVREY